MKKIYPFKLFFWKIEVIYSGGSYMILIKIVFLIFLSGFTLLLVNDYFPQTLPSIKVPDWFVRSTLISVLIMKVLWMKNEKCCRQSLNWLIISTGYVFLLIAILSKVGGDSSTGIAVSNPFIWLLLIIVLVGLISKRNKLEVHL